MQRDPTTTQRSDNRQKAARIIAEYEGFTCCHHKYQCSHKRLFAAGVGETEYY